MQDTIATPPSTSRNPPGGREPLTREEEWKYAKLALTWHGWGSPVGLSVFILSVTAAAVAVRWMIGGI